MKNDNALNDFDNNSSENLQFENELLKLKLRAEFGAAHFSSNIPLEIENSFLKNIFAIEQAFAQQKTIRLFDKLGKPIFKNASELSEEELKDEFLRLDSLLKQHSMHLSFSGDYTFFEKYRFLTEELFDLQIKDIDLPDLIMHFNYEEFHPDE